MKYLPQERQTIPLFHSKTANPSRILALILILSCSITLSAFSAPPEPPKGIDIDTSFYQPPTEKAPLPAKYGSKRPKNIILLIGDGMGVGQLDITRVRALGSEGKLHMQRMPVSAYVSTHSSNTLVTDSAAAATALSTGYKTYNGAIAVGGDTLQFKTILEAARDKGMRTGVVATYSPTHATPASFISHVSSRGLEADIAGQILQTAPDVVLGGGKAYFIPKTMEGSQRKDDLDLIQQARQQGYTFVSGRESLKTVSSLRNGKLLGLFAPVAMTTREPEPSLAEMTQAAIKRLDNSRKGYFLMVEGSQIDGYSHFNVTTETLRQTLLFDQAVAVALDHALKTKDTLVIATADHITGGMNLVGGNLDGSQMEVKWVHGSHLGGQIPLFAFGPGAIRFGGYLDNTDVPKIMADLLKIKDFPKQISVNAAGK